MISTITITPRETIQRLETRIEETEAFLKVPLPPDKDLLIILNQLTILRALKETLTTIDMLDVKLMRVR